MKSIDPTKGTAPDSTMPEARPKDYVVVEGIGDFTYYPSETAMLEDLEYGDEATCVLDRDGNDCRLKLDRDRHLRLGASLGPVEFSWLRQAWMNNRHGNLKAHRLQRFFPETREALLTELFVDRARPGRQRGPSWPLSNRRRLMKAGAPVASA
ncbi:MAG TPA: hypothetical protein VFI36_05035 [Arthrobacter sp.]|nr:hypothetical protein [Arthrobacter sp.]